MTQKSKALPDISFRPVVDDDLPFLRTLYASTREEELAATGWTEAEKSSFLGMQFEAQNTFYREQFSGADFSVIVEKDTSIGRLYREERDDEIRIIDIALLPDWRNRGIGGRILRDMQSEAATAGKAVRIHVEKNNPAISLYQRLGFTPAADRGVYWLMEWKQAPGAV